MAIRPDPAVRERVRERLTQVGEGGTVLVCERELAMAMAFRVGRKSKASGVFVALIGPFVLVALSCITTGVPNPSASWFGVPTPTGVLWGPRLILVAVFMWIFFLFPIAPVCMVIVAVTIIVRRQRIEDTGDENADAVALTDRYRTRYPD